MSISKRLKNLAIAFATTLLMVTSLNVSAFADTTSPTDPNASNTSLVPLEITPTCSDATSSTADWNVNNKNATNVDVTWTNQDNGHTGTFSATPGMSTLITYFDSTDPNNTTQFVSESNTTQTNATEAACNPVTTPPTPPTNPTQPPACVDGTVQQNLVATFASPNTVNVHTVNGGLLCANVTVNLTSYVLPDNYDGRGFYLSYDPNNAANDVTNPTAYPQSLYTNSTATLIAGTDGTTTISIDLPPSCQNSQVDLYYGAVQTTIGQSGTGSANIVSQINPSNGSCPIPPVNGGMGGGGTSGSVSSAPGMGGGETFNGTTTLTSAVSPIVPATNKLVNQTQPQLAYTGQSPIAPYLIAFSLLAATTGLSWVVRRDARNFS